MKSFCLHGLWVLSLVLSSVGLAVAATPIVHVTSPANGSSVTGPVNFVAAARSSGCKGGIQAIRIYSAPSVEAFTGAGDRIDTYINLNPGTYNTVVQAFDFCGNVGKTNVTITVTSVVQPAGFVYTVGFDMNNLQSTTIQGFTIVPGNGALAKTLQGPVTANQDPVALASDKGGFRLYVGDYVSGDVFAYFINRQNGYLTAVPGAPFAAHRSVAAVAVHPSGKLIFAALSEYAQGDGVAVFQLQDDGSLKLAPGSPYATQTGPQGLTVSPDGNYLYVADGSGYIDAFQIDTVNAALTPLPGSPYQNPVMAACGNTYPREVLDLGGKDLYVADGTAGVVDGYAIASTTGTLTNLAGSPWEDTNCEGGGGIDYVQAFMSPRSLAVDGQGKFLYALNEFEFNIAIYSIASNGTLKFKKFTPTNSACAGAVRTDSTGNYLYAGGCTGTFDDPGYNLLVGFSINHTTGDLTALPTSPYTFPETGRPHVQDISVTP